jgi:threonine aldolase
VIDLRSDTVTRPTPEMYEAMRRAPLGDDTMGAGDDPTVHRLQDMAAERMGQEAGLFVPAGMMGNLLAVKLFVSPGAKAVCEYRTHAYKSSALAMAGANSVVLRGNKYGEMDTDELAAVMRPNPYGPSASLLCLENSFNGAGGTALTPDYIGRVAGLAHSAGISVHLDGARIFNAAVALGVDVREFTQHVDTVMFCVSKGLSSPAGSLLTGPRDLIQEARKQRYIHGGSMRQAGILAACGIVSLEQMVDRLAEDHANARLLAEGLAEIPGIDIDLDLVQTNLIWFGMGSTGIAAEAFARRLHERGVWLLALGPTTIRVATHKDVSHQDAVAALAIMREVIAELSD